MTKPQPIQMAEELEIVSPLRAKILPQARRARRAGIIAAS